MCARHSCWLGELSTGAQGRRRGRRKPGLTPQGWAVGYHPRLQCLNLSRSSHPSSSSRSVTLGTPQRLPRPALVLPQFSQGVLRGFPSLPRPFSLLFLFSLSSFLPFFLSFSLPPHPLTFHSKIREISRNRVQIVLRNYHRKSHCKHLVVSFQIFISVYTVTLCFFALLINSAFGCVGLLGLPLSLRQAVAAPLAVAAGLLFATSSLVAEHGL